MTQHVYCVKVKSASASASGIYKFKSRVGLFSILEILEKNVEEKKATYL